MKRKKYGDLVSMTVRVQKDLFVEIKIASFRAEQTLADWLTSAALAKLKLECEKTK